MAKEVKLDWRGFYDSLFQFKSPDALQTWWGCDPTTAEAIWRGKRDAPKPSELHPFIINSGGRGSSKTYLGCAIVAEHLTRWPRAEAIIIRGHWSELHNSIMTDMNRVLDSVTDGNAEAVCEGPIRKEGYYLYTFFTSDPKKPSRLIVRPEPDKASDGQIEDALKGPQYSIAWADELTQLRPITWTTLRDNLRSPYIPKEAQRLLGTTNPPYKGHWLYDIVKQAEKDIVNGRRPQYMFVRSKPEDNPFLREGYVEQLKESYKDDPVMYARLVEGREVVEATGTPIFKGKFNLGRNTGKLDYTPNSPIIVGMDFGWVWNVAVFGQVVDRGYINILGELGVQNASLKQFGRLVQDYITQRWPRHPMSNTLWYGDPNTAVQTNMQTGVTTAVELKRQCGIHLQWKKRKVLHGIDTLKDLLTDHGVDGTRPRLMLDKEHCPETVMALLAGYCWKDVGGVLRGEPDKDGYFDHWADAIRYFTDNVVGPYEEIRIRKKAGSKSAEFVEGMKPRRGREVF